MEETQRRFKRCWKDFREWHNKQKSAVYHSIWNLSDFKFHLARICLNNFEEKILHLDVHDIIPWKRVSLIICEPAKKNQLIDNGKHRKIDLLADIIYGDGFPKNSNRADHELFVLRKTLEFFDLKVKKNSIRAGAIIALNCSFRGKKKEVDLLLEKYPNIELFRFRTKMH